MKKTFKRAASLLLSILVCGLLFNMTAFAEYEAESPIWLSQNSLTIQQGESSEIYVYSTNYISFFLVGNESSATTASYSGSYTGGTLKVNVASDENANTFHIYVYLDGCLGCYRDLEINVQKTVSKIAAVDNTAATTIIVPYTDSTFGTLTLTNEKKIGVFYTESGAPMASFSISNSSGKLMQLTLGAIMSNDSNYVTVKTPASGTISISESDKAVLQAHGIAGLYLNGAYVNWP